MKTFTVIDADNTIYVRRIVNGRVQWYSSGSSFHSTEEEITDDQTIIVLEGLYDKHVHKEACDYIKVRNDLSIEETKKMLSEAGLIRYKTFTDAYLWTVNDLYNDPAHELTPLDIPKEKV